MSRSSGVQQLLSNETSYSFQKIEGLPAVPRTNTITQGDLEVGDKIRLFHLPDGKYLLEKVDSMDEFALTIGKITPAHLYFDEISIKER